MPMWDSVCPYESFRIIFLVSVLMLNFNVVSISFSINFSYFYLPGARFKVQEYCVIRPQIIPSQNCIQQPTVEKIAALCSKCNIKET